MGNTLGRRTSPNPVAAPDLSGHLALSRDLCERRAPRNGENSWRVQGSPARKLSSQRQLLSVPRAKDRALPSPRPRAPVIARYHGRTMSYAPPSTSGLFSDQLRRPAERLRRGDSARATVSPDAFPRGALTGGHFLSTLTDACPPAGLAPFAGGRLGEPVAPAGPHHQP